MIGFLNASAAHRLTVAEKISRLERSSEEAYPLPARISSAGKDRVLPESGITLLNKRDIFARTAEEQQRVSVERVAAPAPRFEVMEITFKPLGIEYQGRIVFADGSLVAQVNMHDKSYLVKSGARLAPYTVDSIDKDVLVLKESAGKRISVKYRQTAYVDELMANIKEVNSNTTFLVSKNSEFFGCTVLDIDEESVLVSSEGEHFRLEKGTVR
jgi:hypothetical protein